MGISRYTAYSIQSSDARADAILCKDSKYQGVIDIYHDGHFHITIISTQESLYESREEAVKSMQDLIDLIKSTDIGLSNKE